MTRPLNDMEAFFRDATPGAEPRPAEIVREHAEVEEVASMAHPHLRFRTTDYTYAVMDAAGRIQSIHVRPRVYLPSGELAERLSDARYLCVCYDPLNPTQGCGPMINPDCLCVDCQRPCCLSHSIGTPFNRRVRRCRRCARAAFAETALKVLLGVFCLPLLLVWCLFKAWNTFFE